MKVVFKIIAKKVFQKVNFRTLSYRFLIKESKNFFSMELLHSKLTSHLNLRYFAATHPNNLPGFVILF